MPTSKSVLNTLDFKSTARLVNLPAPSDDNEASRKIDLTSAVSSLTSAYQAAVSSEQTAREAAIAGLALGISSSQAQALINATPLSDLTAPASDVSFNNHKLTGLANGVSGSDAVNFGQLAQAVAGRLKAVTVQAKFDGTLNALNALVGGSTIVDSVQVNDSTVGTPAAFTTYVLLESSNAAETGVYVLYGEVFARLTGFTTASDWAPYTNVFVDKGTVYGNTVWFNDAPATAGASDAIASLLISPAGRVGEITVNPSGPLRKSGTQLDLAYHSGDFDVDGTGLKLSSGVNSRFTAIEGDITTIEGRLSTDETNISNNSSAITNLQSDVSTLTGRVSTVEGDITSIDGDITALQGRASTLETEAATASSDITALKGRATSLESRVTTTEGSITTIDGEITTINSDITALQDRDTSLESRATALEGRASTLESDVSTINGEITTIDSDITTLQGRATTLEGDVSTINGEITTIDGRLDTDEAAISSIQAKIQQYYWRVSAGSVVSTNAPDGIISYDSGTGRYTITHNKGVIADIKILEINGAEAADAVISKGVPIATMLNEAWVELPASGSFYLVN